MRTLILALTVLLLAAPVWADVEITAEPDGGNPRKVVISYVSTEAQLIRAFALDIVATGGNVIDVCDYAVGDDNSGFGIFPGSFRDNIVVDPCSGKVVTWAVAGYSPVAPSGDPDALGGLGTPGVTVEMGSLYPADGNAPSATGGILCTVTVDDDVTKLCVTANAIRGNVVLEDANEPQNLTLPDGDTGTDCVDFSGACPFPSDYTTYDDWVTYGKPDCWCEPYHCDGDADIVTSGPPFNYRVYTGDLNAIIADWKKKITTVGIDPCADVDHKSSGAPFNYRVYTGDLNKVIANWKKKDTALPGDCPRPE